MKTFLVRTVLCSLAIGSAGVMNAPAALALTSCNGTIADTTVNDSVNVPAGATCVVISSTINGNVTVLPGGSVTLVGVTVNGSFISQGAHDIRLGNCLEFGCAVGRPTVVNGPVIIQGTTGVPSFPTKNVICDATFAGSHVVLQGNSAPFAIGLDPQCGFPGAGNRVVGHLVLQSNTASIRVAGTTVGGTLACVGNSPTPTNGGGNTAGGTSGQCAGF